jgi:hypothetical protein
LSKKVVEVIEDGNTANQLDESTIQLIKHIHKIENQK